MLFNISVLIYILHKKHYDIITKKKQLQDKNCKCIVKKYVKC